MPAVAISDHGNMFGAIEFFTAARKAGIKPLVGMEAYLAPRHRSDKEAKCIGGDTSYHLLLLAQNLTGYHNLLKLATLGYREGFYYKPRIDKEALREFSEGLICTSTCLGAELPQLLLHRDQKMAEDVARSYLEIFGPDRFFIELQDHGIPEQRQLNPALLDMARRLGVAAIATNDVHYLHRDDAEAHDVLCCISTGSLVNETDRFKFPSEEFYLKTGAEMATLFPDHPELLSNTLHVADLCNLELSFGKRYAPVYHPPQKKSDNDYLRELVYAGALQRYGERIPAIRERIDYELSVIAGKGFSSYFLIVWDFVEYARRQGIPCGARGSACSSVVGYCLGLSAPDPLRYELYFERFMDPDRDEMPDIDIDLCQEGRQQVLDYVRQKYGHVAQIITFGTLKARAAVKDVARVLGIEFERATKLTELIPAELHMTIDKALESEPELAKLYQSDPLVRKVIDISKRIEGLARHAGVHAAGVVIADQPLENFLPLYKPPAAGSGGLEQIVTQYDGPTVEKVGLLKMDFLGLRTLTTLERARQLAEKKIGRTINLDQLDLDDQSVYRVFAEGDTRGIFQFESDGMRDVLRKMKPNRIHDLIAANALYRPGPMVNIDAYVSRKHGEAWTTPHPLMTEVLAETYGIMVYQEQVSRLVNRLGNIELKKAFRLAKAISKKNTAMIAAMREDFLAGCRANGLADAVTNEIFENILRFGGYAFNKAHSTGYALIAFQTAYMKCYHPLEFMAAVLTFEMGNTDKVIEHIEECRRMQIVVKPPDINSSGYDFTPVYPIASPRAAGFSQRDADPSADKHPFDALSGYLRFGLGAIKGLGEKAVQAIIHARTEDGEFKNLYEFCERVDLSAVHRGAIEALIKAGAFDSTGAMRKALMTVIESAYEAGQNRQRDRLSGQMSLMDFFAGPESPAAPVHYPAIPANQQWSEAELLAYEKEVLGFYITNHPLAQHEALIRRYASATTRGLATFTDGTEVVLGGLLTKLRTVVTKSGRNAGARMGIATVEDTTGSVEVILFPADLERFRPLLLLDRVLFFKGLVDRRREIPALRTADIIPLEEVEHRLTQEVHIRLSSDQHPPDILPQLETILRQHPGEIPVLLQILTRDQQWAWVRCGPGERVLPSPRLRQDIEQLLGLDSLTLAGPLRPAVD
ncbi:MAG: DNA polymerase III subunit alpha [Phycisphaerae bacterium]|nr:DNA polymerase III subunit alpha [Phycisphaerae bacterium]